MSITTIGNLLATIGGFLMIVSYLPQIKTLHKTKNAKSQSISFWIVLIAGLLCVTTNMTIQGNPLSVLAPQLLNIGLALVVLIQVLIYKKRG